MKNKLLKIVPILIILILAILTIRVDAAYRSNDPTVESGGTFSITLTSTEPIKNFDASLVSYSGLKYVSCSGVDNSVIVNNGDGSLSGATINGYTTLGTYTFQAPEVTEKKTYTVSFNINDTTNNSTVTVNPKTVTQPEPQKPSNTIPTTPEKNKITAVQGKFSDVNETVYATQDVNIRRYDSTDDGSDVIGKLSKGQSITRTGVSSNGWSRVKTSNGVIAYISSRYLDKTNPNEQQNNTNTITNTVTNTIANETTNTMTNDIAGIVDEKFDDEAILKLKSLKIKGADISSVFNPDIYEYKISVKSASKLEIEAVANQSDAIVEILGNEDFEDGENLVTIMLKSADGSQTSTYQIIVTVGEVVEQVENNNVDNDMIYTILFAVIGLIVVVVIAIIVLKIKARKNDDIYGNDYEENNSIFNYDKEVGIEDEDEGNKRKKGKHF